MTGIALRHLAGFGAGAALCVTTAVFGQTFTGTLDDVLSHGAFSIDEVAGGPPQLLTIYITNAVWADPGEVMFIEDDGRLSDRVIFFNQEDDNGRLRAQCFFGSDDEQGNLPPELPPIGTVPILGQFPEGLPLDFLFTAIKNPSTPVPVRATCFSDGEQSSGQSDFVNFTPVPAPGTLALFGAVSAFVSRRRR
jgi:hypothetical protein